MNKYYENRQKFIPKELVFTYAIPSEYSDSAIFGKARNTCSVGHTLHKLLPK